MVPMTSAHDPHEHLYAPVADVPAASTSTSAASADAPAASAGTSAASAGAPTVSAGDPAASAGAPAGSGRVLSDDPAGLLGAEALRPVSLKLIPARYMAGSIGYAIWLVLIIAAIVGTVLTGWWWIAACGLLPLLIMVQSLLFTPRRVRAIGYLDDEEDLTIASGIMFRSVHTIPYGRVQSVKIGEGPVERRYGLATLTITTAAGGGTETLPGLPKAEAERLRSLLTDRGIDLMAAL